MGEEQKKTAERFAAGGFSFTEEAEAAKAAKEAQGIAYVRARIDLDDPQMVLQMYNKIVEQHLFETEVGYAYLKELQEYLCSSQAIDKKQIHMIPVAHHASEQAAGHAQQAVHAQQASDAKQAANAGKTAQTTGRKESFVNYRTRFRVASFACVVLAACVVGMFAVTSTTNNATVLNYETEVINRYEAWEEELNAREQELTEREAQLDSNQTAVGNEN